jgi:DNA-binding transcriptional MerR regulator
MCENRMTTESLLWPAEAAEIAGVSTEWLRRLADRGVLGVTRMGPRGIRLYARGDIERLANRRSSTGGDTSELTAP